MNVINIEVGGREKEDRKGIRKQRQTKCKLEEANIRD